ncbi:hypothetical protein DFH27DRAFT_629872 [Peziza echinospora]|nr:hypothetical protein DFH27DRAFT_629872 [Peziza echinospora]
MSFYLLGSDGQPLPKLLTNGSINLLYCKGELSMPDTTTTYDVIIATSSIRPAVQLPGYRILDSESSFVIYIHHTSPSESLHHDSQISVFKLHEVTIIAANLPPQDSSTDTIFGLFSTLVQQHLKHKTEAFFVGSWNATLLPHSDICTRGTELYKLLGSCDASLLNQEPGDNSAACTERMWETSTIKELPSQRFPVLSCTFPRVV